MKTLCILGFVGQFFLILLMIAARWLHANGLIDEYLGREIFNNSAILIVVISPISIGSATMSIMANAMLSNPAFCKIWSEHIKQGYPHTWILWNEVRKKYESLEDDRNF